MTALVQLLPNLPLTQTCDALFCFPRVRQTWVYVLLSLSEAVPSLLGPLIIIFFWYLFIVHTCVTVCLWSNDNLWEMVLSFHHVSLGAQTHVLSFGSKGLSAEVSGGPLLSAILNLLPTKPNRGVGKITTMWNLSLSDLNHLPLVCSFIVVLKVHIDILLILREHPGNIPSQSKEIWQSLSGPLQLQGMISCNDRRWG